MMNQLLVSVFVVLFSANAMATPTTNTEPSIVSTLPMPTNNIVARQDYPLPTHPILVPSGLPGLPKNATMPTASEAGPDGNANLLGIIIGSSALFVVLLIGSTIWAVKREAKKKAAAKAHDLEMAAGSVDARTLDGKTLTGEDKAPGKGAGESPSISFAGNILAYLYEVKGYIRYHLL